VYAVELILELIVHKVTDVLKSLQFIEVWMKLLMKFLQKEKETRLLMLFLRIVIIKTQ